MFFGDDENEFQEQQADDLNSMLFAQVSDYLATANDELENSDALLWVEADQHDDELLDEINEVLPPEDRFRYDYRVQDDGIFDITLMKDNQTMEIDYDAPFAYDEIFGYLFATVFGAQVLCSGYQFRWWIGFENTNELEEGVRPLLILKTEQWRELEDRFGADKVSREFEIVR